MRTPALKKAYQRLQTFSARLLETQERERYRVAHELHEGICQALAAMKMNLQTLQTRSPGAQLDECMRIADGILQRVRDLSLELRAPHELGLEAAVRSEVERRAALGNITVDFRTDTGGVRLDPALEMTCFRVIEEALENVYRHADAGRVWIELATRNDTLQLTISDDGKGFDVLTVRENAAHGEGNGLSVIFQRVHIAGGCMDIESSASLGTEIRVTLPLRSFPSARRARPDQRLA